MFAPIYESKLLRVSPSFKNLPQLELVLQYLSELPEVSNGNAGGRGVNDIQFESKGELRLDT